jgi:hypothetical protein
MLSKTRNQTAERCCPVIRPLLFFAVALFACKPPLDPRFVPVRAEREPGLVKTLADGGNEYALLQLNQYSSLYGVKDFWVASRKKGGAWGEPQFTGVVYQFAPPKIRYIPSKILDFRKEGETFTLILGVPEEKRKNFADVPTYTRQFTLAELSADADKDGFTDITEKALWLNPENPDTDGDGVTDKLDKDPLATPRQEFSDEEQLQLAAFGRYRCDHGEVVIFQDGTGGLFTLPQTGCINIMLKKEQIDAYSALDANGLTRYDRPFDVIRFAAKIQGNTAKVKIGTELGYQTWLFAREDGKWEFEREAQHPEIYNE